MGRALVLSWIVGCASMLCLGCDDETSGDPDAVVGDLAADKAIADSGADLGVDGAVPDLPPSLDGPPKDQQIVDGPAPDKQPMDGPQPDQPDPPDLAIPDQQPAPDQVAPDQAQPDAWPTACKGTPSCASGWCTIPPGTFTMGSSTAEACRDADESQHPVTVTRCFEIQETEATQQEFMSLMGYNPSTNTGCNNCPVDSLDWDTAVSYCNQLSTNAGLTQCYSCGGTSCTVVAKYNSTTSGQTIYDCPGYRLPTEAEWEYAARAGETKALHNGFNMTTGGCDVDAHAGAIAWYSQNSSGTSQPVKLKTPNNWGLHDMAGNVGEWTTDQWMSSWPSFPQTDPWLPVTHPAPRFTGLRGGRFSVAARYSRSANRTSRNSNEKDSSFGVRCVRSLTGTN